MKQPLALAILTAALTAPTEVAEQERATSFFTTAKKELERDFVEAVENELTTLEDKLFDKSKFIGVDDNREAAKIRFKEILDTELKIKMLTAELRARREVFDKYFNDAQPDTETI